MIGNLRGLYCPFINNDISTNSDEIIAALKVEDIDARPTFYPVHTMPSYEKVRTSHSMDNSE